MGGKNLVVGKYLTVCQGWKQVVASLVLLVLGREVLCLIYLQETVKGNNLARCHELAVVHSADGNDSLCALYLCICHLACYGALPYQFVQPLFLGRPLYLGLVHIGGTDGLVCLLCPLATGVVLACLGILLAYGFGDMLLAGSQAEFGKVHAVGTHVGNHTAFIQALGYHHGLCHAQTQSMCSFLLQCRGGKWRCRSSFGRFLGHFLYGIFCTLATLQEGNCFFLGLEAA